MAAKIRKGDKVVVLTGRDKGKTGEVEQVFPKEGRAVVGGINMAVRHVKQSPTNQGGRQAKALPIHLSNLALIDKNGKATRVGFRFDEAGNKIRYAKTTGDAI
ncbi:50S ribosomal protein L24 [Rubellimicrobium sp. CFH 75288]|uniref:50S ribosomal protein L24 n=1 Tax=Rubellimicrobium sp. CFH 75288 TaxID=2697034 RepID=UPI0014133087|nr:50S ribosomal protein L24 [Rubellimicrobium sp. CFH 75288]NAZ35844.1 50S ribosomal protein L24 [Rubellimicrobium sp. CFH 75288]